VSPKAKNRVKRFSPLQRLFHVVLMVSFLIQGATGLGRMYYETQWGRMVTGVFGGYEATLTAHIYVGLFMIFGFLLHVLYLLFKINWRNPTSLFGPDSIVPHPRDIKQFFQHVIWFIGLGKLPRFERWGYWEKFDYWAVFWGIIIMGGTGMFLAYPLISTRVLPGWGLNVAFWVHRIEALLAMAHVFIIHFFIAHLRRHNFPMDRAMFEGSVDLESMHHEKPDWLERLEESGNLEPSLVPAAGTGQRAFYYVFGYAAVAIGIFLLVGALINTPRITW